MITTQMRHRNESLAYTHAHTYTHTHIHTLAHTYAHTHTQQMIRAHLQELHAVQVLLHLHSPRLHVRKHLRTYAYVMGGEWEI